MTTVQCTALRLRFCSCDVFDTQILRFTTKGRLFGVVVTKTTVGGGESLLVRTNDVLSVMLFKIIAQHYCANSGTLDVGLP